MNEKKLMCTPTFILNYDTEPAVMVSMILIYNNFRKLMERRWRQEEDLSFGKGYAPSAGHGWLKSPSDTLLLGSKQFSKGKHTWLTLTLLKYTGHHLQPWRLFLEDSGQSLIDHLICAKFWLLTTKAKHTANLKPFLLVVVEKWCGPAEFMRM